MDHGRAEELPDTKVDPEAWKRLMYIEKLPDDIKEFKHLLEKYSKIPRAEVENHIFNIREKAWNIANYPCIGYFSWLRLGEFKLPEMQLAIAHLTAPGSQETFLEIGCFVGQITRNLVFQGLDPARAYATDLHPEFLELGYELFRDRDKMREATFLSGDLLAPDAEFDTGLGTALRGKASIILAGSFFHLFNREQQLRIGKRIVPFFRPGIGKTAMLFGMQLGSVDPGEKPRGRMVPFWHNQVTFQALWDEIGESTGTRWKVEVTWLDRLPKELLRKVGWGDDARMSRFVVTQVVD